MVSCKHGRPLLSLLLIGLLILVEVCGAVGETLSDGESPTREEQDCKIEGDEGLYGIGVRLGIYFQIFASMFTMAFQRDQGPAFLYAAAALQAALFVALVYASAHRDIHSSEALIALMLLVIIVLFECLVMTSIFIHLLSGHFRLVKTDQAEPHHGRPGPLQSHSPSVIDGEEPEQSRSHPNYKSGIRQSTDISEKAASGASGSTNSEELRRVSQSDLGLVRQKTRRNPYTEQGRLNLREAIYASNPLLISDDNLALMARTVGNYASSHVWASFVFIILLITGCYVYMMWFWWSGMSHMRTNTCGAIGFFIFAPFEIEHWIRWPIRIFLSIASLAFLGLLLQITCTVLAFVAVLVFQLSDFLTERMVRRSAAVQDMRHFYSRVVELGLPLADEYILTVLVFKSFLSHWPDRIFLAIIGKDPQKKAADQDLNPSLLASGSDKKLSYALNQNSNSRQVVRNEDNSAEPAEAGDTVQSDGQNDSSSKSNEQNQFVELPRGLRVRTEDFFLIRNPNSRLISWPNRICFRFLKPRPLLNTETAGSEYPDRSVFVIPYDDNFETLTVPLMILLGHLFYFTIIGILLAAGIWSVELTIRRNHIEDVNHLPSAAQLIPFIIGAGSFCQSGFSALGELSGWSLRMIQLRRGSNSWFDAVTEKYFYEAPPEHGAVNVEHLRHFPLMLVMWMLFPSMKKGQSISGFKEEFTNEMNERGGFFVLDLLD